MRGLTFSRLVTLGSAVSLASCTSSSGGGPSDDAGIDVGSDGGDGDVCRPRADPKPSSFYGRNALPSGPCSAGPVCHFKVEEDCPCPTDHGPIDGIDCSCELGQWACVVVFQGATGCARAASCIEFDAAGPSDASKD